MLPDRPVVWFYAGPSIRAAQVRELCGGVDAEIHVLPPIEQGDILRYVTSLPDVIGIIDGFFHQVPAVLHKEILYALEQGVRVLGAASLGALRAAELHPFGMEGVGTVFELLASQRLDGDDEVAVLHGPPELEHTPLTLPLVNLRETLKRAEREDVISSGNSSVVLTAAKNMHFSTRTWQSVLNSDHVRKAVAGDALESFTSYVEDNAADIKREDAVVLVDLVVRRLTGVEEWPVFRRPAAPRSRYLHIFEREYFQYRPAAEPVSYSEATPMVSDLQVLSLYKLLSSDAPRLARNVATIEILADEARERRLTTDSDDALLRVLETQFPESDCGHTTQQDALNWIRTRQLVDGLLQRTRQSNEQASIESESLEQKLVTAVADRFGITVSQLYINVFRGQTLPWDMPLLTELKMTGGYQSARKHAETIHNSVNQLFASNPNLRLVMEAMVEFARDDLEQWIAELWAVPRTDLFAAAESRTFCSISDLLDTARLAHLYEQHGSPTTGQHPEESS